MHAGRPQRSSAVWAARPWHTKLSVKLEKKAKRKEEKAVKNLKYCVSVFVFG